MCGGGFYAVRKLEKFPPSLPLSVSPLLSFLSLPILLRVSVRLATEPAAAAAADLEMRERAEGAAIMRYLLETALVRSISHTRRRRRHDRPARTVALGEFWGYMAVRPLSDDTFDIRTAAEQ